MIWVKEKEVTFGKPYSFPSFGWDVDYGTISVRYAVLCSFNQHVMYTITNIDNTLSRKTSMPNA